MSATETAMLCLIAVIGHLMALFWLCVEDYEVDLSRDRIYDLPIKDPQVRRELKNSLHTPLHAVVLMIFLLAGLFSSRSVGSFFASLLLTAVWAEIWHYSSHRAFHLKSLHWIHAEHHKSRLSSPFTALSFSFWEKFIFDLGILGALALIDVFVFNLNFFGIAAWFAAYLVINSYGHANYEIRSETFMKVKGKYITSTVYHALHHSRYTGNYGLGTRFLDRLFKTEWPDSEAVFDQVVVQKKPLSSLRETVGETEGAAK
ncbi:sterol desaturase family protein [Labrenzia sp. PHM005]|uniref:sterol desaturase family protein n=1 Tax=Labrenzia sp. PHM005 TaxID=2590016 RepID=UPI001140521C|nr:sterol desaturase family protein [Labrenzia sp. PHM005]QDG78138.1 sterol desaturase family protein [Labrenzia sp. PHM005]